MPSGGKPAKGVYESDTGIRGPRKLPPGEVSLPSGIGIDSSGNVYVADPEQNRIQKFTTNGRFVKSWSSVGAENSQFFTPRRRD